MSAVALRETTRLSHFRHVVTDSPVTLVAAALFVLIVVVALCAAAGLIPLRLARQRLSQLEA